MNLQILYFVLSLASAENFCPPGSNVSQWLSSGANIHNTRRTCAETKIGVASLSTQTLKTKWSFGQYGPSATPTVIGNHIYFPDWKGMLWCLNRKNGRKIWSVNVTDIIYSNGGLPNPVKVGLVGVDASRTSPAIDGNSIFIGTHNFALVVALNRRTGAIQWVTKADTHPLAILTGSFTVANGLVLVSVVSNEEAADEDKNYKCCSFIGHLSAFDTKTGALRWKRDMLPKNRGYAGAGVWGSSPSVDTINNQVLIATGNTYTVSPAMHACREAYDKDKALFSRDPCVEADVYQESVLALDLYTGAVNWVAQLSALDAWTLTCGVPPFGIPPQPDRCPKVPGPDADFGEHPMLIRGNQHTPRNRDMAVVGQKNGIMWALDLITGQVLWSSQVGPGSAAGGLIFGGATDGKFAYASSANMDLLSHTSPSGQVIKGGSWAAVNLTNGAIVWQTGAPTGASTAGSVSLANGVLYGTDKLGGFYAMDTKDGRIVAQQNFSNWMMNGPAIVDGTIYLPTGYRWSPGYAGKMVALGF